MRYTQSNFKGDIVNPINRIVTLFSHAKSSYNKKIFHISSPPFSYTIEEIFKFVSSNLYSLIPLDEKQHVLINLEVF